MSESVMKPNLPQNKMAAMQDHFNENDDQEQLDFEHNEQEINKYQTLKDDYIQKRKPVEEFVTAIGKATEQVNELYRQVLAVENELDNILETRAHKEIFLQVYEGKGIVEKLYRNRYAKRVSAELERDSEGLFNLRKKYIDLVKQYNESVIQMKKETFSVREKGLVEQYKIAKTRLVSEMKLVTESEDMTDDVE